VERKLQAKRALVTIPSLEEYEQRAAVLKP